MYIYNGQIWFVTYNILVNHDQTIYLMDKLQSHDSVNCENTQYLPDSVNSKEISSVNFKFA